VTHSQFRKWIRDRLAEVEPKIKQPATEANAAIVIDAKANAYSLGLYDLASLLPEPEKLTALDCCLLLRKCLDVFTSPTEPTRNVYSIAQAARQLGVSPRLVYRLCESGELECKRIGRRITITAKQLSDYQERDEWSLFDQ
jgi:excisionase family DNA binding protein